MAKFIFQAFLTPEEDGGYSVEFPDLPGCFSSGDTYKEAVWMAGDAAKTWLASRLAHNEAIPEMKRHETPDGVESVMLFVEAEPDYVMSGDVVSAAQAARMLGVSAGRVTHMIDSGILEGFSRGRRTYISKSSIEARLASPRGAGRPKKTEALQADSDGSVDRELKLVHEASGMAARMSGLTDDESERLRNLCAASTREETHADMYDAIIDDMEASHI